MFSPSLDFYFFIFLTAYLNSAALKLDCLDNRQIELHYYICKTYTEIMGKNTQTEN